MNTNGVNRRANSNEPRAPKRRPPILNFVLPTSGSEARYRPRTETTMSNPGLPPETVDHIVDILHNNPKTLRNCSLTTKSWVPRARKHLFASVRLTSPKVLESWKKTFPDPRNSPAYHTLTLFVYCPEVITAADAEEGGWIQAFSRVVCLDVYSSVQDPLFLTLLYGLSPFLEILRVSSIASQDP